MINTDDLYDLECGTSGLWSAKESSGDISMIVYVRSRVYKLDAYQNIRAFGVFGDDVEVVHVIQTKD